MAQFVSGSRGESRGEAACRDVNFSTGDPSEGKGEICGNTERSALFPPSYSSAILYTRASRVIVRCHDSSSKKKKKALELVFDLLCREKRNDVTDARWTSVQSYARRKLDDQIREADIRCSISDATLSRERERERVDQGCNAVWT